MRGRRLIEAGLEYFGLQTSDLKFLKKGDERKLALAALVRRRTSVTNRWLTDALDLGHISRVSHLLQRADTLKLLEKLEKALLLPPVPPCLGVTESFLFLWSKVTKLADNVKRLLGASAPSSLS